MNRMTGVRTRPVVTADRLIGVSRIGHAVLTGPTGNVDLSVTRGGRAVRVDPMGVFARADERKVLGPARVVTPSDVMMRALDVIGIPVSSTTASVGADPAWHPRRHGCLTLLFQMR